MIKGDTLPLEGVTALIQKLQETEQRLQQEHNFVSTIVDRVSSLVVVLDRQGCIVRFNRACEELTGYLFDEIKGRHFAELLASEEVKTVKAAFENFCRGQFPDRHETHWVSKKGCRRLITWSNTALFDQEGEVEHVIVTGADITELRRAEEALRESGERFRLLTKATKDVIWDWNLITNEIWWNEGFEILFGYERDEVEKTFESWAARIHPEDAERLRVDMDRTILAGSDNWSGEYRFLRKDGSYAHVLDRSYIIRNKNGQAVRMVGAMTDLTRRKQAEDRMAEQAALLDIAHEAILVKDLEGRIIYWNKGAERVYGWTASEVLGRKITDVLSKDVSKYHQALAALLKNGEWQGEMEKHTRDGRVLTVEVRYTLVRDEDGKPKSIFAIHTDITERKKLEAQLLRVQRMESIGTLASGIAHDLNNVLSPILMAIELLSEKVQDESARDLLATLKTSSLHGADLIKQVLSFARGVEGQHITLNPIHLLRDIEKMIHDTFPKNIDFRFTSSRHSWLVTGDATQLDQVFMNLCLNARDAMPGGGTLTVITENIMLDELYAGTNPESQPGPYVMVTVADTGTGIPREIQDKIFEPFFTTKEMGKGTGLGLSTTIGIVRSHKGFINLYSEPGKGTTFKIYLPANTTSKENKTDALPPVQLLHGKGERVLFADDDAGIRTIARGTLERYGYRVLLATNGEEAVSLYRLYRDKIAVVITDMAMPVMDGPSAIVALQTINPQVKIIGSSGLQLDNETLIEAHLDHFLPKPYTAGALLKVLAQVLSQGEIAMVS